MPFETKPYHAQKRPPPTLGSDPLLPKRQRLWGAFRPRIHALPSGVRATARTVPCRYQLPENHRAGVKHAREETEAELQELQRREVKKLITPLAIISPDTPRKSSSIFSRRRGPAGSLRIEASGDYCLSSCNSDRSSVSPASSPSLRSEGSSPITPPDDSGLGSSLPSSDTSDCTAVKGEGSSKKQSLKSRKAPTKVRRRVRPVSDEDAAKIRRRRKNTTLKDIDRDTRLRRALALSDDEKRTVQRRRRSFSSEESTKEDDDSEPESLAKERPRRGRSRTVSRPVLDPVDETSEAEGRSRAKDTPAKKPRAVTDEEGETKDNGSNTESNSTRSSSRSSRSRSPQSRRCPCGRMVADKDGSSSESSHSDNESGDKAEAKTTKRKSAPVADEKDKPKEDKERSAEEETEAASAKDDGSSDVKDDNSEMDTEPVVTEEEDGEIMPVVDEMDLSDSVNVVNDEPVKKEATKDDSEETSRASEKKPALETVAEEADREDSPASSKAPVVDVVSEKIAPEEATEPKAAATPSTSQQSTFQWMQTSFTTQSSKTTSSAKSTSFTSRLSHIFVQSQFRARKLLFNPYNVSRHAYRDPNYCFSDDEAVDHDSATPHRLPSPAPSCGAEASHNIESCLEKLERICLR